MNQKIDSNILNDPELAREALQKLLKTKKELDDFIDTLELLSDKEFRKKMDASIEQVKKGEFLDIDNIKDFRKVLEE